MSLQNLNESVTPQDKMQSGGAKFGGVMGTERAGSKQPLQEQGHRNAGFPEESGFNLVKAVKAGAGTQAGTGRPENLGVAGRPRVSLLARWGYSHALQW